MTERIGVLIADDQAITRTGLQHLLAEDTGIEVVGAARTGAETMALAEALQPDVILMDLRMPDGKRMARILKPTCWRRPGTARCCTFITMPKKATRYYLARWKSGSGRNGNG